MRWSWKLGLAALALAAAFALDGAAYRFLHANFNKRQNPVPPALRLPVRLMEAFEKCGESLFAVLIGAALWQTLPRRRGMVACLAAAAVATALGSEAIKRTTGRGRPDITEGRREFHGPGHFLDAKADWHSFPSGHTAAAGAYGGVVVAAVPPLRGLAILTTIGVGSSRMWSERHFLSDTLAGGMLGWLIGAMLARAALWRRLDQRWAPRM